MKPKPSMRQPSESERAYQAFRAYLDLGPDRNLAAVGRKLGKSTTQMEKWSAKWKWVKRVIAYTDSLTKTSDDQVQSVLTKRILGANQVLAMASFLATASLDGVLNAAGGFDIKKARKTGTIHALKQITYYRDGSVKSIALRDKNASLELIGKHLGLWTGEIEDPDAVIARILRIPRAEIPSSFEPVASIAAESVSEQV